MWAGDIYRLLRFNIPNSGMLYARYGRDHRGPTKALTTELVCRLEVMFGLLTYYEKGLRSVAASIPWPWQGSV
jgi:hypothetical protein